MNGNLPQMTGAWYLKTAWIDKEVHRWGVCLMIVIAIHAGLIFGFAAWKEVDHIAPPSTAIMIDLGPLPGLSGHGLGSKPVTPPRAAAKHYAPEKVEKHEHFHRLVKLRTRIQHLLKPRPKMAEYIPLPSAVPAPKPPSRPLVASANAATAGGSGSIQKGSSTGSSVHPSDGCCGMSNDGAAGSGQGSPATWQGLLLADLEAHKRYPAEARDRGEQGVVYLRFSMDRRGKVLSSSLEKSSGFDDLDQETLDLIQRSQPLPPPPATITGRVIELVVPVQFQLQQDD